MTQDFTQGRPSCPHHGPLGLPDPNSPTGVSCFQCKTPLPVQDEEE